ncbi:MAG: transglycosylase domain-containing protein [Actinomycetota bacterium]|nr:transglycosylase domain-containing protein [Actinomycetota bacterium]
MLRSGRLLGRLVVVLALSGALLAATLGALSYSASRLVNGAASSRALPLGNLVSTPDVPSVIYGADGSVLATLRSTQNRQPVPLKKISPLLVDAVLDTEDHNFWVHGGVDIESIVRALVADIRAGGAVQGGSTIAEELAKIAYLSDQKTLVRKVRQAVLALRLEQRYTKTQILDAYLNTVYLGSGAYGVQAASEEYFGKSAAKVDLAQAALLAGLIQAPSGYDPVYNPLGAKRRRAEVLARMVHYKSVTPAEAATAANAPLPTAVHDAPGVPYTSYGYYVSEVVDELMANPALGATPAEREHELLTGGLEIFTNEVPSLQAYAQKVAQADIPPALKNVVAAFAVIDPQTGGVEALIGGPSGQSRYFDAAVQGERQPGSGFKLFTLIALLESGYDVYDSILATSPCAVRFPGVPLQSGYSLAHPLHNDPGDPTGAVTVVEATALSINCAYLRLGYVVGLQKVIDVARSMGLSDPTLNASNPSLVIGTEAVKPIEMAAAYATVADGGIYHRPTFIQKVVAPDGTVIYNGASAGRRVFSAQIAAEATVALRAVVQYGTGTAAALPNADVAGKTGTTSKSVDAWFNGITPTLVSSVWIGDPAGEVPMYVNGQAVFGAMYPTEIWHDVMAYALRNVAYSPFPSPDPALMPSVEYIDTPGLQRNDLISHGELPPPPTTTTTAPPAKARAKSRGHGVPGGPAVVTTTGAQPPPHVRISPAGFTPPPATPAPGAVTATAATVSQATGASASPTPAGPPGKTLGAHTPPPGKASGGPSHTTPPGKAPGGP